MRKIVPKLESRAPAFSNNYYSKLSLPNLNENIISPSHQIPNQLYQTRKIYRQSADTGQNIVQSQYDEDVLKMIQQDPGLRALLEESKYVSQSNPQQAHGVQEMIREIIFLETSKPQDASTVDFKPIKITIREPEVAVKKPSALQAQPQNEEKTLLNSSTNAVLEGGEEIRVRHNKPIFIRSYYDILCDQKKKQQFETKSRMLSELNQKIQEEEKPDHFYKDQKFKESVAAKPGPNKASVLELRGSVYNPSHADNNMSNSFFVKEKDVALLKQRAAQTNNNGSIDPHRVMAFLW